MTVFENVAYGLRVRREIGGDHPKGRSRARHGTDGRYREARASAIVGWAAAARRAGARLRVPARGAAVDEPLSNLDAKLRATCASSCASCNTASA